jgi:hypothetical protein
MASPRELLQYVDFPVNAPPLLRHSGDIFFPTRPLAERHEQGSEENTAGDSVYASPNFERESPIGEDKRQELVRLMAKLPSEEGRALWQSSANLKYITDNEASHRALDRVYSGPHRELEADEDSYLFADGMLSNLHNAMGSRNRKRIVKQVLREYTNELRETGKNTVNVLSIAAGSSRAVLEAAADMQNGGDATFHIRLTDIKHTALDDGLVVANSLGIKDSVEKVRAGFLHSQLLFSKGFRPDFVEAVGIVDYLQDDEVASMLRMQLEQLPEGGEILFSNVAENDEQQFLHTVIGWRPMIYRTPEQLQALTEQAGFARSNITHIPEPLGQCNLLLASK